MGKKRNLNGLANSLEQRYFSTLFYWKKGYMADWIWNAAKEKGIQDIEIDILNRSVIPIELEIEPITSQLYRLHKTIAKTLESNDFPKDFFVDARLKIRIGLDHQTRRLISCQGILIDKDERMYVGKTYTEEAYETPFRVFTTSWRDKIRKLIGI